MRFLTIFHLSSMSVPRANGGGWRSRGILITDGNTIVINCTLYFIFEKHEIQTKKKKSVLEGSQPSPSPLDVNHPRVIKIYSLLRDVSSPVRRVILYRNYLGGSRRRTFHCSGIVKNSVCHCFFFFFLIASWGGFALNRRAGSALPWLWCPRAMSRRAGHVPFEY